MNDIVAGFGYNSSLRIPEQPSDVPGFLFLAIGSGTEQSADDIMLQFTAFTDINRPGSWFKPKQDAIWLAAGKSQRSSPHCNTAYSACRTSMFYRCLHQSFSNT